MREAVVSIKRPGLPWLIALLVIPLLIATIGYEVSARSPSGRVSSAPSTSAGAPKFSLAAFSMVRNGNSVTLSGDFPDESAKVALLKVLTGALPPGLNIVDQIRIDPAVDALDFAKAKPVFSDSASVADFALTVAGDTITLAGTAASPEQKNTIDTDAKRIWPTLNVVDNLAVNAPAASPSPTGASCTNLQSAINTLTDGALTFESNVGSLTASDGQILTRVADKLKACPNAHAAINGYADNTGNTSLNVPLSEERAQAVAGFLEAQGVPANRLSTTGFDSANPIAPNGTDGGRAQNRRVEIVIS
ncbi:peptidoglycan-binding protein ArfA [Mycobacterium senriense]|uniref:Peptidoglycan-binding protein ArfA n=1 Tax=Mycobacterium senriense TaxID=2775496 RepID=A0ABM7SRC6_9MYCO|nr:peptidoglycan-binding protein ArfA [Mycobacterium senriense]